MDGGEHFNPDAPTPGLFGQTVAAIATPFGEGGIGIVHVTGPDAVEAVAKLFQPKRPLDLREQNARSVHYGHIVIDNEPLDEVLVRVCRRHESFTGSDLVEINCHGGIVSVHRMLECLERVGVRAVPAADLLEEAVRRGRIDAVRREAIVELFHARSPQAVAMLLAQERGSLSNLLREIEKALVSLSRHCSRARGRAAAEVLEAQRRTCHERLTALESTIALGYRLCHSSRIVIAGRANVGKSSLFNAMCHADRAITSDRAGTTRDFVTAQIVLDGFPFELIDTAGIREGLDLIEIESVRGSWEQIARAHVALAVFDASTPPTESDRSLVKALASRVALPVLNKIDRGVREDVRALALQLGRKPIEVCARTGEGLEQLRGALVESLGAPHPPDPPEPTLFTERQHELVQQALASLSTYRLTMATTAARRTLAERARAAARVLQRCRLG